VKVKIRTALAVVAGILVAATSAGALADDYPSRPIRLVVPFPAGSSTDIAARLIGQKLGERLGKPVIVENKPGAGGNIGTQAAAMAPADGYTLLMATVANAISASLYKNLQFDFLKDFAPVTLVGINPLALVANNKVPAKNLHELIAYNKVKSPLFYGSGGLGTSTHLAGEMLKNATGMTLSHVPYKGATAAGADLLGGQIDLMFDAVAAVMANVRAGNVKVIAVTSAKRASALPDVPTIAESGVPGFEAVGWIGVNARAGTPKEIVDRLNREIVAILALPDVQKVLTTSGIEIVGDTPAQYDAFTRSEIAKWANVVKTADVHAE